MIFTRWTLAMLLTLAIFPPTLLSFSLFSVLLHASLIGSIPKFAQMSSFIKDSLHWLPVQEDIWLETISLVCNCQLGGGSDLPEIFSQSGHLYTHIGLLAFLHLWSYGYPAHALCCSPILELWLCWSLNLERYSTIPMPGITRPLTSPVPETPYDFPVCWFRHLGQLRALLTWVVLYKCLITLQYITFSLSML